jgi:hypothetical protein
MKRYSGSNHLKTEKLVLKGSSSLRPTDSESQVSQSQQQRSLHDFSYALCNPQAKKEGKVVSKMVDYIYTEFKEQFKFVLQN